MKVGHTPMRPIYSEIVAGFLFWPDKGIPWNFISPDMTNPPSAP